MFLRSGDRVKRFSLCRVALRDGLEPRLKLHLTELASRSAGGSPAGATSICGSPRSPVSLTSGRC